MGKIVLLDDLTINQIAAGEVIERPASVVKELVENSIDAGAKNISVDIKNGGISYIRVVDDGSGIMPDDMEIAFERHATSKIRKAEDLDEVKSMGFRGEALASIGAIAKIDMISRTEDEDIGYMVSVEGGEIIDKHEEGAKKGTAITIKELFYNTPVRYKFLKKDFTESGYIEDVVTRIALANPDISIKLSDSGKTIIQTNGTGKLNDCIYEIYGKEVFENVLPVDYEYEDYRVTGVIGKPIISRSNRTNQLFFVNKRYVKDKTLSSAAEQGFKGLVTIGKHGFLILNIEMDPKKVDVNVHPTKLEVRFQEDSKVFKAIFHSIKETLLKGDLVSDPVKDYNDITPNDMLKEIKNKDRIKAWGLNKINSENNEIENVEKEKEGADDTPKFDEFKNIVSGLDDETRHEFINQITKAKTPDEIIKQVRKFSEYIGIIKDKENDNIYNTSESEEKFNNSNIEKDNLEERNDQENQDNQDNQENINNDNNNNDNEEKINLLSENEIIYSEETNNENKEDNNEFEKTPYEDEKNNDIDINADKEEINPLPEDEIVNSEEINNENREDNNGFEKESYNYEDNNNTEINDNKEEINNEDNIETNENISESINEDENDINIEEDNETNENAEEVSENLDDVFADFEKLFNENKKEIDENISENELYVEDTEHTDNTSEDVLNEDISNEEENKEEIENKSEETTVESTEDKQEEQEEKISFEEMYKKLFGRDIATAKKEHDEKIEENKEEYDIEPIKDNEISLFSRDKETNKTLYQFVGIAFKTYIILTINSELYILDQHAAHERIMYEKVKKNYFNDKEKDSQIMLLPDVINLNNKEMGIFRDNKVLFNKAGFIVDEFGDNTVKLTGVPDFCLELDTKEIFIETLDEIDTVARTAKQELEDKFLATVACKAAVKANMALTKEEVDSLMEQLLKLPNPFSCPHGRPTVIKMSKNDIEKKFSRR